MLGQKNPLLVDRTIYAFKGKWQNPQQDISTSIYYFISNKPTFSIDYNNGREELKQTLEITCSGEHAFCVNDMFYLQNGEKKRIVGIANNYFEPNIAVRDMLKQRIESQILVLE